MSHEFVLAGMAGACAGFFTNPIEVVKTRIQLQGELAAKGQYARHYRNPLQAFYIVARTEGFRSLQKGLVPGTYYQVVMNGIRLGVFQTIDNAGLTRTPNGDNIIYRTVLCASLSGCIGSFVASPFFLVSNYLTKY